MDKVLELWQNYCIGRTNVIYERYKFNNRSQEANESIDAYATALCTLAETCEFGSLKDDLIWDRLVCGIGDNGQRKKLLQELKLTLEKCLDSCRAAEATKLQVQDMTRQSKESSEVNVLKSARPKSSPSMVDDCKFCGKSHKRNREKCPAFGQICKKCKKENHVVSKCHLHGTKSNYKKKKPKTPKTSSKESFWKKVNAVETDASSDEELLTVELSTEFVVVDDNYTPLIAARAAQQMGFIVVQHHNILLESNNEDFTASQSSPLMKEQVLTDFADIFKGLGKMERKLHLEVNESVPPVIMPPRRVPVALKGKFKEEIDCLVSVGVL